MQRLGLLLPFILASGFAYAAEETYELEGAGYAQEATAACTDAVEYTKHQALLRAGALMVQLPSATKDAPGAENDFGHLMNDAVKVTHKEEQTRPDRKGNTICVVKAKLAIDADAVIKYNLQFKGKFPAWIVVPPEVSGNIRIIAKDKTLDGAVARALHKYAERLAGEHERITHIENLLDGKETAYARVTQITPEISVKWKRKFYIFGDKKEPLFIHTFTEQTIFRNQKKVRQISCYREIESENGFASNFEDESSGESKGRLSINKASATMQMMLENLKKNGIEIQYAQVKAGGQAEWYVLLTAAGKPSQPS